MRWNRRFSRSRANVDLIPMIDVVFQLILFFLVSTTFALMPGIVLNLPESETAESTETTGLVITVESGGGVWLNQQQLSLSELEGALASYPIQIEKRESYPVSLEADGQVTNATIVRILDALRKTGFSAVNLRTLEA